MPKAAAVRKTPIKKTTTAVAPAAPSSYPTAPRTPRLVWNHLHKRWDAFNPTAVLSTPSAFGSKEMGNIRVLYSVPPDMLAAGRAAAERDKQEQDEAQRLLEIQDVNTKAQTDDLLAALERQNRQADPGAAAELAASEAQQSPQRFVISTATAEEICAFAHDHLRVDLDPEADLRDLRRTLAELTGTATPAIPGEDPEDFQPGEAFDEGAPDDPARHIG